MGRIAAIDYGRKRIGIALTDERKKVALPLCTVEGGKRGAENVCKALSGKMIDLVLVGLPLLLNGQEGEMAGEVKKFAERLTAALGAPIEMIDERFSSKLADQSLRQIQLNRKERTERMDEAAATLLLQYYLDRLT